MFGSTKPQHSAKKKKNKQFRGKLMPRLAKHEQALLRSQIGVLSFSTALSSLLIWIIPISGSLSLHVDCRCGFWKSRVFAVESAGARVCQEGRRTRVVTKATLRNCDLVLPRLVTNVGWRFWRTCLPLFGRARLPICTTLVIPLALRTVFARRGAPFHKE